MNSPTIITDKLVVFLHLVPQGQLSLVDTALYTPKRTKGQLKKKFLILIKKDANVFMFLVYLDRFTKYKSATFYTYLSINTIFIYLITRTRVNTSVMKASLLVEIHLEISKFVP